MAGDGPQTQPPINVVTNSSSSSTTATATNPANTPITTSGATTRDGESQPPAGAGMPPGKPDPTEVGPPPHPGKHEGKPSTTWTPPFVGSSGNQSQVGQGGYGRHSRIS